MGWAERVNLNSWWNRKRRPQPTIIEEIEREPNEPKKKSLWQKILSWLRKLRR